MTIILTSILPICLLIALGTLLSMRGFLPPAFFTQLNRLGFYILLPALLFHKIAGSNLQSLKGGMLTGVLICGCSAVITLVALVIGRWMRLPRPSSSALAQAAMRGNLAYAGLPIILFMFGPDSEAVQVAVIALIPSVPFFNFAAVLILTAPEGSTPVKRLKRTALSILLNPLIIGCLLGLVFMLTGSGAPQPLMRALQTLGQAALPCALLSLGAGLSFSSIRSQIKPAAVAATLKLVTLPLLGYLVLQLLGVQSREIMFTSMIYLAAPSAVTSYVMAEQMGADKELAAAAVTLSTLCAMPVLALLLLFFG